jgi:hypothetical protein
LFFSFLGAVAGFQHLSAARKGEKLGKKELLKSLFLPGFAIPFGLYGQVASIPTAALSFFHFLFTNGPMLLKHHVELLGLTPSNSKLSLSKPVIYMPFPYLCSLFYKAKKRR